MRVQLILIKVVFSKIIYVNLFENKYQNLNLNKTNNRQWTSTVREIWKRDPVGSEKIWNN